MFRNIVTFLTVLITVLYISESCLITNCPRGGKRNHFHRETNIKPCISCGPGNSGQCFGSNICCGPFGCLIGTAETVKCQREGFFEDSEPCVAGNGNCRKNTGRCATENICCTQESCYMDKSCNLDEKVRIQEIESLYNMIPIPFPNQMKYADINTV